MPFSLIKFSISIVISLFISYLFTQTIGRIPKCSHKDITLFKSSSPDVVGSVTISVASDPVIDAITAHPIPGEPSIIVNLSSLFNFLAFFLRSVTNFPEPSLPTSISALEINPLSNFVIKVSAVFSSSNFIAFCGHINVHVPHPSHKKGSILKFSMASNLQTVLHFPHSIHLSLSIVAFFPPIKLLFSISFPS